MGIQWPIHQQSGCPWNILDDTGCRIAICGYDDDHEDSGPAIAAELVAAANHGGSLEVYKTLHEKALGIVDRVFQTCTEIPEPILPDFCELGEDKFEAVLRLAAEFRRLRVALAESVKLQSHYAGLLNMYDGGQRMEFASADAWIARLDSFGALAGQ